MNVKLHCRYLAAISISTILLTALVSCATSPAAAPTATIALDLTATPQVKAPARTANLDSCARVYDPEVDYFPEKAALTDASGFKVEYFKNYKIITVTNPWLDAKEQFKYVLVQCGTPAPSDLNVALLIEVPAKTIVAMSTTQLPHLDKLRLLDRLVGLDSFAYVSNATVRQMIKDGKLAEIGGGGAVNVEKAITLKPDLIMAYGVGDPQYDAHPKLLEANLKTVLNSEYMENSPLGRAEWIKFIAMFFNREGEADQVYAETAKAYNDVAAKAKATEKKPTVITGTPSKDTWYVAGGQSYVAQFLTDAGASYIFAEEPGTDSTPKTFEEVFDQSSKAETWLLSAFDTFTDTVAVKELDSRLGEMNALKTGNVWNYDLALNENGGNDYFESGVANPHVVLADLVAIFHPELMPEHKFVYFRKLQ